MQDWSHRFPSARWPSKCSKRSPAQVSQERVGSVGAVRWAVYRGTGETTKTVGCLKLKRPFWIKNAQISNLLFRQVNIVSLQNSFISPKFYRDFFNSNWKLLYGRCKHDVFNILRETYWNQFLTSKHCIENLCYGLILLICVLAELAWCTTREC